MYNLYVTVEDARPERRNTTTVRFLVFCDNDILLRLGENGAWDTPLVSVMPMRPSIGNTEALIARFAVKQRSHDAVAGIEAVFAAAGVAVGVGMAGEEHPAG